MNRNLVYTNQHSGNALVQEFKGIIQAAIYPDDPLSFSGDNMAIAVRTCEAYKKNSKDLPGLIDLMLFLVECGTQLTNDFGDIDEDFYIVLEETFEDTLKLIQNLKTDQDQFNERIYFIAKESSNTSYGYGDQIEDLIHIYFPDILKMDIRAQRR